MVADIRSGSTGSDPQNLVVVKIGGKKILFFRANDGVHGFELWKFDGKTVSLVADLAPGLAHGCVGAIAAAVEGLYFIGCDAAFGCELWKSDCTKAGTVRVTDLARGPLHGLQPDSPLESVGGKVVVFRAKLPFSTVLGVYTSDGTAVGTKPASGPTFPEAFQKVGDTVYFRALDFRGIELWAVSLKGFGSSIVRYGSGCSQGEVPEIFATPPSIGNDCFAIGVRGASANTAAILMLAAGAVDVPLSGCKLHVSPIVLMLAGATDGKGQGKAPLSLPNLTSLIGLELYAQWLTFEKDGKFFGFAALSNALKALLGR